MTRSATWRCSPRRLAGAATRRTSCRKLRAESLDAAFVRCGLAGMGARLAQVLEIQTAPVEQDTAQLRTFAAACQRQARAANPRVVLIATLSTQPGGKPVNGWQLAQAAQALRPFVQGFQLNMTRWSTRAAIAFLRSIPALSG
jgi:hypothetical protein